jgi:hypothetical protein
MGEWAKSVSRILYRSSLFKRDFGSLSTQNYPKLLTTARELFQTISTRLLSIIISIPIHMYYSTHHFNRPSMAEITMFFNDSNKIIIDL